MRVLDAAAVDAALPYRPLVEALREQFREGCEVPVRHQHTIQSPGGADATMLLMPAWQPGAVIGTKLITIFPDNPAAGLASILGVYLLADGKTGQPLALVDAPTLTARRTGAASALAADYLARKDAGILLMVGAGTLAPHLVRAHASVRPIREVLIWNRTPTRAKALATALTGEAFQVSVVADLEAAARRADVISCATMATAPLVKGVWLKPGAHLDLVGGYTPAMRECDDDAVRRARIYLDTMAGGMQEAGDVVDPIQRGVIAKSAVIGDLAALCRGAVEGRRGAEEITLFKSVGTALEDLAGAKLALARAKG